MQNKKIKYNLSKSAKKNCKNKNPLKPKRRQQPPHPEQFNGLSKPKKNKNKKPQNTRADSPHIQNNSMAF
jgi:hypothetical protein